VGVVAHALELEVALFLEGAQDEVDLGEVESGAGGDLALVQIGVFADGFEYG
jgi:hypothetical protein